MNTTDAHGRPVPEGVIINAHWLLSWDAETIVHAGNNISLDRAHLMVADLLDGTPPSPPIGLKEGTRVNLDGGWFRLPAGSTIENRGGQAFLCYPVNLTT